MSNANLTALIQAQINGNLTALSDDDLTALTSSAKSYLDDLNVTALQAEVDSRLNALTSGDSNFALLQAAVMLQGVTAIETVGTAFRVEDFSATRLSSGLDGELISVTAPAGKVIRLLRVIGEASAGNMTLVVNGSEFITGDLAGASQSAGLEDFGVIDYAYSGIDNINNKFIPPIYCESFSLTANESTLSFIYIAYEIGEIK